MSTSLDALHQRIHKSTSAIDQLLAKFRGEEVAERERSAVERARADSAECEDIRATYAPAFEAFNAEVPAPSDGADPGPYRRKLDARLARRLPPSHDLARIDSWQSMPDGALVPLERDLFRAAAAEAKTPSFENLPEDGRMIQRTRTDEQSGHRENVFYGRRSFIADFAPQKVRAIICDPRMQNGRTMLARMPMTRHAV